jgi:hypothetical protein
MPLNYDMVVNMKKVGWLLFLFFENVVKIFLPVGIFLVVSFAVIKIMKKFKKYEESIFPYLYFILYFKIQVTKRHCKSFEGRYQSIRPSFYHPLIKSHSEIFQE